MDQILTTALGDQSRYHAISLVANEYLNDPSTTWHEKKAVLHGLQEYNVKQIFYMSLVNVSLTCYQNISPCMKYP